MKLYQKIAQLVVARHNCIEMGNSDWLMNHSNELDFIAKNQLPSGSGIDCGTTIDADASNAKQIVLELSFHHMDDCGYYDGWTAHTIKVRPAFDGIDLTISGRNRNEIKDYLHDVYHTVLTAEMGEAK